MTIYIIFFYLKKRWSSRFIQISIRTKHQKQQMISKFKQVFAWHADQDRNISEQLLMKSDTFQFQTIKTREDNWAQWLISDGGNLGRGGLEDELGADASKAGDWSGEGLESVAAQREVHCLVTATVEFSMFRFPPNQASLMAGRARAFCTWQGWG